MDEVTGMKDRREASRDTGEKDPKKGNKKK